jgi:Skp family chaperone for outer membrane proteins
MGKKYIFFGLLLIIGLGFVGGILGSHLFAPQEDTSLREDLDKLTEHVASVKKELASLSDLSGAVSALKDSVTSLEREVARLKQEAVAATVQPATTASAPAAGSGVAGLKIAYVDLQGLLDEIFALKASALEAHSAKLDDLRRAYEEEKIDKETYTREFLKLQVEGLKFQVDWSLALLRKLRASFGELSEVLQEVEDKLQPLEDQVKALDEKAEAGVPESELQNFLSQYQQLQLIFQQLEQLLSQTLTSMLAKIAGEVAAEEGIAIVIQRDDVLYLDPGQVIDLSEKVKERAPEFFGR